jgi:ABC-type branched-subunit amino acid transport system substrate-binding protein
LSLLAGGCHVFAPLENCSSDRDCALGDRCDPDGKFCAADHGPLIVGATLPMSGDLAGVGAQLKSALDLAASEVNAAGGVLGRPLQFDVRDDQTDIGLAMQNTQAFVDERAYAVIGPWTSAQALASQSITGGAHVVQISSSAGAQALATAQPATDRYFFRTISSIRLGTGSAVPLFAHDATFGLGCKRMAMVNSDDVTGHDYADAIGDLFARLGGCTAISQTVPTAVQVDYKLAAGAVIAARPDCGTIVALPPVGIAFLREFEKQAAADTQHDWSKFRWMGTTSLHSNVFLVDGEVNPGNPVPNDAEGMYGGDVDSTPDTPEYRTLRALYDAYFPSGPGTPDLAPLQSNTYDAAMLVALAITQGGTTRDRVKIRDGLWAVTAEGPDHHVYGPGQYADAIAAIGRGQPIHYKGGSGELVFDAYGDVTEPTLIWNVQSGAFANAHFFTEEDAQGLQQLPPAVGQCM